MDIKFTDLGLRPELVEGIQRLGFESPSPIQAETIPVALSGKDIVGLSQTGSGKTAAFGLPALNMIDIDRKETQVLVLCPTRELAVQVCEEINRLASCLRGFTSVPVYGGTPIDRQMRALRNGAHVVVGTPGRIMDHLRRKTLRTDAIKICILDEADRMLDMGFQRDINKIMGFLPKKRQNLLFSATFSKEIKTLAQGILNQPVLVEATPENTTVDAIIQRVYKVDKARKTELIIKLIKDGNWNQVLVFTRTKHGANNLTKRMLKANIEAAAIHGNKSQGARTKALAGFKDGTVEVLVATDIAARGLDIPLLPHVINFELPNIPEDYVHRIGRTGRAGARGEAISLVCIDEKIYLRDIERVVGMRIPSELKEGFEPDPNIKPEPVKKKGNSRQKGSFNRSGGGGRSRNRGR